MPLIEVKHNTKTYQSGTTQIDANHDISFTIDTGELVIILGASGPASRPCSISSAGWTPTPAGQ